MDHSGTLANAILLDCALSQALETSNMRASPKDTAINFGARAMLVDRVKYEDAEQSYLSRVCCLTFRSLCFTEDL